MGVFSGGGRRSARERAISERLREICKRIFYDRREVVSFRVVCKKTRNDTTREIASQKKPRNDTERETLRRKLSQGHRA